MQKEQVGLQRKIDDQTEKLRKAKADLSRQEAVISDLRAEHIDLTEQLHVAK